MRRLGIFLFSFFLVRAPLLFFLTSAALNNAHSLSPSHSKSHSLENARPLLSGAPKRAAECVACAETYDTDKRRQLFPFTRHKIRSQDSPALSLDKSQRASLSEIEQQEDIAGKIGRANRATWRRRRFRCAQVCACAPSEPLAPAATPSVGRPEVAGSES